MRMCIWSANLVSFLSSQPSSHVLTSVFIPPESFSFIPFSLSLSPCKKKLWGKKNSNEDQRDFIIAHYHKGLQAYINKDSVTGKKLSASMNVIIMMIFQRMKLFFRVGDFWCWRITKERTHISTARSHNATAAKRSAFTIHGLVRSPLQQQNHMLLWFVTRQLYFDMRWWRMHPSSWTAQVLRDNTFYCCPRCQLWGQVM